MCLGPRVRFWILLDGEGRGELGCVLCSRLRRGSGGLLLSRRLPSRWGSLLGMGGGTRAIGGGVDGVDGLGRGGFLGLVGEIQRGESYEVSFEGW